MSTSLPEVACRTDATIATARAELVHAVRRAAASGMTQAEIARQIGRSQPEVSRLLHFHGTSVLAMQLRRHAAQIRKLIADVGGTDVRVFGSVAVGADHEGSDIDLLFHMGPPLSLMELGGLEHRIGALVGSPVDLLPDAAIRPELRERILAEAVAL